MTPLGYLLVGLLPPATLLAIIGIEAAVIAIWRRLDPREREHREHVARLNAMLREQKNPPATHRRVRSHSHPV